MAGRIHLRRAAGGTLRVLVVLRRLTIQNNKQPPTFMQNMQ